MSEVVHLLPEELILGAPVPYLESALTSLTTALVPDGMGATISWVDDADTLRVVTFDATLRVGHSGANEITSHAVDVGATVSDHVVIGNNKITIEAEVTNTPITGDEDSPLGGRPKAAVRGMSLKVPRREMTKPALLKGGEDGGTPILGSGFAPGVGRVDMLRKPPTLVPGELTRSDGYVQVNALTFDEKFDRVADVLWTLDFLRRSRTLVRVDSRYAKGNNGYVGCLVTAVSAPEEVADSIMFVVELEQIQIAGDAQYVDAQPRVTEPRAKKPVVAGKQPGYANPEPLKETTFKQSTDGIKGVMEQDRR